MQSRLDFNILLYHLKNHLFEKVWRSDRIPRDEVFPGTKDNWGDQWISFTQPSYRELPQFFNFIRSVVRLYLYQAVNMHLNGFPNRFIFIYCWQ